jgi:hypothetical protein
MARYLQFVAMRTLAVLLIAWPGSYGLAATWLTGDFYWLSIGLGAPLFGWSLILASASLPHESVPDHLWHGHTLYGDELATQMAQNAQVLRNVLAEAEVEIIVPEAREDNVPYDLPQKVA